MDDVKESIRDTIGGFIGNIGDFRDTDLQYLRMKMDMDKEKHGDKKTDAKAARTKALMSADWPTRHRSKSQLPVSYVTRGSAGGNLIGQSNQDSLNEVFQVEHQLIADLMRRSAGVLEMDHDLMIQRYEKNYLDQIEHMKKIQEKFDKEVKSEIDTIPRGMKAQFFDMD